MIMLLDPDLFVSWHQALLVNYVEKVKAEKEKGNECPLCSNENKEYNNRIQKLGGNLILKGLKCKSPNKKKIWKIKK